MNPSTASLLTGTCRCRQVRVCGLLALVVALSAFDLTRTLHHLSRATMVEANPIARWIMSFDSTGLLVAWKTASVAVAVMVLLPFSRRASGEIGALVSAALLVALTFHWFMYDGEINRLSRLAEGDNGPVIASR